MEYYKYRVVVKILDKDAEIKKRKISHIVRNPFHVYSKKLRQEVVWNIEKFLS